MPLFSMSIWSMPSKSSMNVVDGNSKPMMPKCLSPHLACVTSALFGAYRSGKVCNPVGSTLMTNSPLPTESVVNESNDCTIGLLRLNSTLRSIGSTLNPFPMRINDSRSKARILCCIIEWAKGLSITLSLNLLGGTGFVLAQVA